MGKSQFVTRPLSIHSMDADYAIWDIHQFIRCNHQIPTERWAIFENEKLRNKPLIFLFAVPHCTAMSDNVIYKMPILSHSLFTCYWRVTNPTYAIFCRFYTWTARTNTMGSTTTLASITPQSSTTGSTTTLTILPTTTTTGERVHCFKKKIYTIV